MSPGPNERALPQGTQASSGEARLSADARFDEILARLRGLVDKLESGNLSLEDGLHFFEEGMVLCRCGSEILDQAEKRVEVLLSASADGVRTAPLDAPGSRPESE